MNSAQPHAYAGLKLAYPNTDLSKFLSMASALPCGCCSHLWRILRVMSPLMSRRPSPPSVHSSSDCTRPSNIVPDTSADAAAPVGISRYRRSYPSTPSAVQHKFSEQTQAHRAESLTLFALHHSKSLKASTGCTRHAVWEHGRNASGGNVSGCVCKRILAWSR